MVNPNTVFLMLLRCGNEMGRIYFLIVYLTFALKHTHKSTSLYFFYTFDFLGIFLFFVVGLFFVFIFLFFSVFRPAEIATSRVVVFMIYESRVGGCRELHQSSV
jgi:hypothetical protein